MAGACCRLVLVPDIYLCGAGASSTELHVLLYGNDVAGSVASHVKPDVFKTRRQQGVTMFQHVTSVRV